MSILYVHPPSITGHAQCLCGGGPLHRRPAYKSFFSLQHFVVLQMLQYYRALREYAIRSSVSQYVPARAEKTCLVQHVVHTTLLLPRYRGYYSTVLPYRPTKKCYGSIDVRTTIPYRTTTYSTVLPLVSGMAVVHSTVPVLQLCR